MIKGCRVIKVLSRSVFQRHVSQISIVRIQRINRGIEQPRDPAGEFRLAGPRRASDASQKGLLDYLCFLQHVLCTVVVLYDRSNLRLSCSPKLKIKESQAEELRSGKRFGSLAHHADVA